MKFRRPSVLPACEPVGWGATAAQVDAAVARGTCGRSRPYPRVHSTQESREKAMTEIATRNITDDELSEIKSFEDAANLLKDVGAVIVDVTEYGTGFKVVEKDSLVGVPFVILSATFREGDYGDDGYVSIEAVTKNNDKVVINDGSSGIRDQMRRIVAQRHKAGVNMPDAGIVCPDGLTRSDYWRNAETGETSTKRPDGKGWEPATTFYISQ